jgi:hypothetical protein
VVQAAEVLCVEGGAALTEEGPADCSPSDVLGELGAADADVEGLLQEVPGITERARTFLA